MMNIPTEIYYGVKNDTTVLKTKQFKHGQAKYHGLQHNYSGQ